MIHLTEKDYAVSRWSGGTTTQIALFPPESSYAGRDFLWRVSSRYKIGRASCRERV